MHVSVAIYLSLSVVNCNTQLCNAFLSLFSRVECLVKVQIFLETFSCQSVSCINLETFYVSRLQPLRCLPQRIIPIQLT